jgi:hypothetical protein
MLIRNCAPNIMVSFNKRPAWRAILGITFIPRALPRAIDIQALQAFLQFSAFNSQFIAISCKIANKHFLTTFIIFCRSKTDDKWFLWIFEWEYIRNHLGGGFSLHCIF